MSKNIPSSPVFPQVQRYATNRPVRLEDWRDIIRAQNYAWSRVGARIPGLVFDPPAGTTSTTYNQTNDIGARNLDTWWGRTRLLRVANNSGAAAYRLGVSAVMRNMRLRLVYRTPGGSDNTIEATVSGATFAASSAFAWVTSPTDLLLRIEWRIDNVGVNAGVGELALFEPLEEVISTTTFMPTGR